MPLLDKAGQEVTSFQMEASKEINTVFPDALRSHVLRYVQFQTIPRMDDLGKLLLVALSLGTVLTHFTVNNVFDVCDESLDASKFTDSLVLAL